MIVSSRTVACALAAGLLLTACSKNPANEANATVASDSSAAQGALHGNLKITSWGPDSTRAGVTFNAQPNGEAALWVRLNQSIDGYQASVEFDGTLLPGNVTDNLVTAGVPAMLYAKPGAYTLRVIARKGTRSLQSNEVAFTVQ